MLDCNEWYLINAGTAGTAVADAHFITSATAKAQRIVWQGQDYGFPPIKAALGVESLAAGVATHVEGYAIFAPLGGGMDPNWYRWRLPIPFMAIGTTELWGPSPVNEPYDKHILNMPAPEGSTLADGTVSKVYASAANTYIAIALYRQFGTKLPTSWPGNGHPVTTVVYDKGGDCTTVVWNTLENAKQNAAGELQEDHDYRLLWASFDAQALGDKEANLARITVPGYPPLLIPGAGSAYSPGTGARRVWFLDDSIKMRGDSTHKAEGHVGAACQPTLKVGWEDLGKVR